MLGFWVPVHLGSRDQGGKLCDRKSPRRWGVGLRQPDRLVVAEQKGVGMGMEEAVSREAGPHHGGPLAPWKRVEIAGHSRTFESGMFSVSRPSGEMSKRAGGGTSLRIFGI